MAPTGDNKDIQKDIEDVAKNAKGVLERYLGDISKQSAAQQIAMGAASGWCTGLLAAKVGKVIAVAVGGSILILQVAHHSGYVTINWDKVVRRANKVTDKIEERISEEGPNWMNKVEKYVDRKLDKVEDTVKSKKRQARRWYHKLAGTGPEFQIEKIHIFSCAFVAGVALGLASG